MTQQLERRAPRPVVSDSTRLRSFELAKTPREALELLRAPESPPVLSPEQAKRSRDNEPFTVVGEDEFTIYKPWSPVRTIDGIGARELRVGPAVTGQLVRTARGSRLDVFVRRYAVTPSQRRGLTLPVAGLGVFALALVVLTGAHAIALGLAAVILGSVAASVLLYGKRQRDEDIRELLAVVTRTYARLELPAASDSPRRRDHPPDDVLEDIPERDAPPGAEGGPEARG